MVGVPVRFLLVLGLSALLFACATHRQPDVGPQLEEIRKIAEQAAADAAAARRSAEAAQQRADDARLRADEAMSTAAGAKSQSQQTEAKIDRMFKKAMYK